MGVLSSAAVTVRGRPPVSHSSTLMRGRLVYSCGSSGRGPAASRVPPLIWAVAACRGFCPAGAEQQTAARLEQ